MKKRYWISILLIAAFVSFGLYAYGGSITKGLIGKEDVSKWDGVTSTFTRTTADDYTLTLNKIDWPGVDVLAVYGGGVNRTKATLTSALTDVGAVNEVRFFLSPGEWAITADLTITSNVTLYVPPGASLAVTAAMTLTIEGPIEAGDYQIFSGAGAVLVTGQYPVRSIWYSNVSAAVDSIAAVETELIFNEDYVMTANITVPATLVFKAQKGHTITTTGFILTINGPFEAGLYQVFSGTGSVEGLTTTYPEWWGIDGVVDQTEINRAVNAIHPLDGVVILTGSYSATSIVPKDGVFFRSLDATITVPAASAALAHVFNFAQVVNSGIRGHLIIDGNRDNQVNTYESGQIGVNVGLEAQELYFDSLYIKNMSFDGFYFGCSGAGDTEPENIYIHRLYTTNCWRNGMSVTSGGSLRLDEGTFHATDGNNPQAGLDIEPNNADDDLSNLSFGTIRCISNEGNGLQILGAAIAQNLGFSIEHLISYNNVGNGVNIATGSYVNLPSVDVHDNDTYGIHIPRNVRHIYIHGKIYENAGRGVAVVLTTQAAQSYDINVSGSIYDNGQVTPASDGFYADGEAGTKLDRVRFTGELYDTQGVGATQRYGFALGANVTNSRVHAYTDGNVTGPYSDGSTSPDLRVNGRYCVTGTPTYGVIAANTTDVQTVTVTGAIAGMRVTATPAPGLEAGLVWSSYVSAGDTVSIIVGNVTVAGINPTEVNWYITVE